MSRTTETDAPSCEFGFELVMNLSPAKGKPGVAGDRVGLGAVGDAELAEVADPLAGRIQGEPVDVADGAWY